MRSPVLTPGKRHIKGQVSKSSLSDNFDSEDSFAVKDESAVAARDRKSKTWWWVALAAGAVAIGVAVSNAKLLPGGDSKNAEVPAGARTLPFDRYIAAPGRVESVSGRRELAFHSAGRIRAFYVEENQAVRKGELLGELENGDLQARVKMAQADLQGAQAGHSILEADLDAELARARYEVDRLSAERELLTPGEEEIARARAEMRAAQAENKRRQTDAARNVDVRISTLRERDMSRGQADISEAQLDAALARVKELEAGPRKDATARARALIDSAKADVKRLEESRLARLQSSEAKIAQAQANLLWAEAELAKTRLLSPIDGRVVRKFGQPGETVSLTAPVPVIVVADDKKLRVRASIDEGDFLKIKPGQLAKIGASAFEGKYLEGTVESVCPEAGEKRFSTGEARERQDVKVIEIIVRLNGEPQVKLGLRVTAYLEQPLLP